MARITVHLSEAEQAIVASERFSHADLHVRRKMLVLWAVHTGLTRLQAAKVAGVGRATAQRYLAAYRDGGLEGLRRWALSDLSASSPVTSTPSKRRSAIRRSAPSPKPPTASNKSLACSAV